MLQRIYIYSITKIIYKLFTRLEVDERREEGDSLISQPINIPELHKDPWRTLELHPILGVETQHNTVAADDDEQLPGAAKRSILSSSMRLQALDLPHESSTRPRFG
jgi:hypothetical protein